MTEFPVRKPTVREVATVTVSAPVDGTVRRRGRGPGSRPASVFTHQVTVRPDVWAVAKSLLTPQSRLVIESGTSVLIVNRKRESQ